MEARDAGMELIEKYQEREMEMIIHFTIYFVA